MDGGFSNVTATELKFGAQILINRQDFRSIFPYSSLNNSLAKKN